MQMPGRTENGITAEAQLYSPMLFPFMTAVSACLAQIELCTVQVHAAQPFQVSPSSMLWVEP